MYKAKTLQDFEQLQKTIELLNKDDIWKLRLEIKQEHSECDLFVIDETEELYYGGFAFDRVMESLEKALRFDAGDNEAYLDCICPGKWLADFKGRSRYNKEDMKMHIELALLHALSDYADDNGKEFDWSDENREAFDALPDYIMNVLNKILK